MNYLSPHAQNASNRQSKSTFAQKKSQRRPSQLSSFSFMQETPSNQRLQATPSLSVTSPNRGEEEKHENPLYMGASQFKILRSDNTSKYFENFREAFDHRRGAILRENNRTPPELYSSGIANNNSGFISKLIFDEDSSSSNRRARNRAHRLNKSQRASPN